MTYNLKGRTPETWVCIDCCINTAPGISDRKQFEQAFNAVVRLDHFSVGIFYDGNTEVYMVKDTIWQAVGMDDFGGCLCIGCLEKRLGRLLTPRDFKRNHALNKTPGTERLLKRRGDLDEEGEELWLRHTN